MWIVLMLVMVVVVPLLLPVTCVAPTCDAISFHSIGLHEIRRVPGMKKANDTSLV
jgi:hypothetical protein